MYRIAAVLMVLPLLAQEAGEIRTPKPAVTPRFQGPRLMGVRPGKPFLFRIPCTGEKPLRFTASGLPEGIRLEDGILRGTSPARAGEYRVKLRAQNRHGRSERVFTIVVGETLALTPPMGWNHWYTHYDRVRDSTIREAAKVMVESGMADFGYAYVSIDDCWMNKPGSEDAELSGPVRDVQGRISANKRFPDMKGLTDYVHSLGLKAGTYTSPGPLTCAKFVGAHGYEEQDARQIAEWGFDLLKYDWCSYGRVAASKELAELKKPYELMGKLLRAQDRDIQMNLCQYGMGDVWKWGAEVGGQSWRTTGDLGLEKDTRLPGFFSIGLRNAKLWEYAGPGKWNDPDYILIGWVGSARDQRAEPRRAALTADEQYAYMSMWALMASPLFYSGMMSRLDEFTLNVLCNGEVIDVNQDTLGRQARVVRLTEAELVLAKPMEDGSLAVGLFNLGEKTGKIRASWAELGVKGKKKARDLWRQKRLGAVSAGVEMEVSRHGAELIRLH
ncbi:MAG: glycoside hydrolase family 27 protein [Bryobacterales bacterium]|nr:glycoside hydrolase family 27 protein [Bryobacterales bacterium]